MIYAKLKELKEKSGLTTQQIAEKSGIPPSTISRIMSGQTDNPSFQTVADLVKAMGGSLDDLTLPTRAVPVEATATTHTEQHTPGHHDCLHGGQGHCCSLVTMYERALEHKNRWIKNLFIACASLVAVLIILVFVDLLNGRIGFVRY